jgi:uncharacterized protein (UPF0303 family)
MVAVLALSSAAVSAQTTDADAWRTLAGKLEGGTAIDVRLRDGKHFKATFIGAHPDGMLLQRKTRIPVAVEEVAYDAVASLSRADTSSMSGAKVAGIALGSAGAAIGALFLILLATID